MTKKKTRIKKYTTEEKKALGLDKVPDTMYDLRYEGFKEPKSGSMYPEYEPKNPKPLGFK